MASEPPGGLYPAKQSFLPTEMKFIVLKDGAQIDQSHRTTIRSQVMLDFRRKQSQEDVPNHASISQADLVTTSIPGTYKTRFRVGMSDLQKRRVEAKKKKKTLKTRPVQPRPSFPGATNEVQLGFKLTEPVNLLSQHLPALTVIPEGNPHRVLALTHHYFQERQKSSQLMLNLRKGYFQLAMEDSAFFAACISHYAGIISLVTKGGDPTESLRLRVRSMALVNSRLGEPSLSVSDGSLGAVASLINYETNNGTPLAVQIHLEGLKAMLRIRGGFLHAGLSPLLQRMIVWAELASIYFLSLPPTIIPFDNPGLDLPSRVSHIAPYIKSRSPTIGLPVPSTYDIDWWSIDKNPASIFADLRFLSYALVAGETEISNIDPLWYSDKIYLVQRSLVYLVMNPEPHETSLDTACYITASLYVDRRLRDLGARSVAVNMTVSKLRDFMPQVFLELPQHSRTSNFVSRMLWVLVYAGVAANGRPERPWFVEKLAVMCKILQFKSWTEITSLLESILWDDEWEAPHGLVWSEVEAHLH